MISASFIFNQREYDDEYFALDGRIAEIAKATQGYIGEEAWQNLENGKVCTVYYWEGREGLRELMASAEHLRAKSQSAQWLAGYQVVVSEVIATYGTKDYDHLLNKRPFDLGGWKGPPASP
ncbi:antibiotic biosynthesis monooxygenase family protein [Verminephrobacter eiseniae]|uniref:ABM domain-containing protein n=1 Tax=Verminephrobacter eiseniae (strain EF01-2) TaxID=391735 RepID=A1WEC4_VEREI|nr:hypothetical protein [Verminephrobacter eiseniae]ABM55981.1 hypothetical protein Veis_0189 [Verminephrobacter eiseniae EF01-2]